MEYGATDHLTRANFEADVHIFGHGKTVAQTLQLNTLLKDAKDFESFRAEASKLLTAFNERQLRTEFDTAKATANSTANVLRAVASGAKFMRHKATQDTHTRPVHAALHNKVWRIDDPKNTEWRAFISPLAWNCRCTDNYIDEASEADLITPEEAKQLLGTAEVERLTKDGFLVDRIDSKALFTSRQSYLAQLPSADKAAFSIDSMTYAEQGLPPWKDVTKHQLSTYKASSKSKKDALTDFAATAVDTVKTYSNYRGAPLFLSETSLSTQIKTASGVQQYFDLAEIVAAPDEVYFTVTDENLTDTYFKFFADDTVLSVEVGYSTELPQTLQSWQQVPKADIDAVRRGLLIHKK